MQDGSRNGRDPWEKYGRNPMREIPNTISYGFHLGYMRFGSAA